MGQAQERLPWLSDEPAPPAAAPALRGRSAPARRSTARALWPFYLLLLLLVAAVAAGAWWLGTQQHAPAPAQLPVEAPVALPIAPPGPPSPAADKVGAAAPPALTPAPAAPAVEPAASPSARTPPAAASTERRGASAERAAAAAERTGAGQGTGDSRSRGVFPAEDSVAVPPPPTGPRPIVVYHPQPNRGRVVQLGAFATRAQADQAWLRITRRYPYLAGKPKMVNTVEVRSIGGGRGTRMYRLQLGTSSQAQSAVICQQLERAGQSCVVVY